MRIELYCDLPYERSVEALDRLEGLPVDTLIVCVDRSNGKPIEDWYEDGAVAAFAEQAGGREFAVRTMHWPRISWTTDRWEQVRRLVDDTHMDPVMDVEHQAKNRGTRQSLANRCAYGLQGSGRYIVSTHAWHPEADDPSHGNAPYEVQAYSTAKLLGKVGGKVLPPGWQVAQSQRGCGPTRLALAIYDQEKLGARPAERYLERALRGAMACPNIDTVAYWSLKHVLRNKYAIPFLRDRVPEILAG